MSVNVTQVETTYNVIYRNHSYEVVTLEDRVSIGYTQYDVFNEEGHIVEGELEEEVINYFEQNIY